MKINLHTKSKTLNCYKIIILAKGSNY